MLTSTTASNYPVIITRPVRFCLCLIGVWPNFSHTISQRVLWVVTMVAFLTFQMWYCVASIKSADLPDLLDSLSLTLSNWVTFSKLIIIWFNYRLTNQDKQLMMEKASLSSRISNFLTGLFVLACITYTAITFLITDNTNEESGSQKPFMIKMKLPFDITISPTYEILVVIQIIFEFAVAFTSGMLMAFFAALVLHVGSQIDIMCQRLVKVTDYDEETTRKELQSLITKHQRIIYLSECIKDLFTYTSLAQFVANILVICFLGFIIAISINTVEGLTIIVRSFPYYLAVNCEAFILCYTGEYLTSKNERISQAAYNMIWYKLHPRENQILLLLLIRAQKPVTLTAGKFVNLSLETYASMLKASASYISILYAMY